MNEITSFEKGSTYMNFLASNSALFLALAFWGFSANPHVAIGKPIFDILSYDVFLWVSAAFALIGVMLMNCYFKVYEKIRKEKAVVLPTLKQIEKTYFGYILLFIIFSMVFVALMNTFIAFLIPIIAGRIDIIAVLMILSSILTILIWKYYEEKIGIRPLCL